MLISGPSRVGGVSYLDTGTLQVEGHLFWGFIYMGCSHTIHWNSRIRNDYDNVDAEIRDSILTKPEGRTLYFKDIGIQILPTSKEICRRKDKRRPRPCRGNAAPHGMGAALHCQSFAKHRGGEWSDM